MLLLINSNLKVQDSNIPNIRQGHYKPEQKLCSDSIQYNNSRILQTETEVRVKLKFVIFFVF